MYIEDRGGWLPVLYYLATISGPRETWTSTAANILCRELGYKGAASHGYDRGALARDQRLRISIVRCDEEFRTLFNCSYTFQPQNTFTAAATANCSSVTPSVTPPLINCGDPGQVENANRTGTVYSYNSSVKYMCLDGYNINGDDVIRCTLDGTWSAKPVCIEHGSVTEPSSGIGLIIGIAVGIVAVTVGVFAVVFFICRRKRERVSRKGAGPTGTRQYDPVPVTGIGKCEESGQSLAFDRTSNAAVEEDYYTEIDNFKAIGQQDATRGNQDDEIHRNECAHAQSDNVVNICREVSESSDQSADCNKTRHSSDIDANYECLRQNHHNTETDGIDIDGTTVTTDAERKLEAGKSGSVDNVAYESADLHDDHSDVYTDIDDDIGSHGTVDNIAYEPATGVTTTADIGGNTVDDFEQESSDGTHDDAPAYFVLDGP
ncbi:uncharacterized protein [Ptychodera flava]